MTPTAKLRWIVREGRPDPFFKNAMTGEPHVPLVTILQQWWEDNTTDVHWIEGNPGEWRDVPLEKEQ